MAIELTRNQFKEHVDKVLTEKGVSHDMGLWFIDISYPEVEKVGVEDEGLFCPTVHGGESGITIG